MKVLIFVLLVLLFGVGILMCFVATATCRKVLWSMLRREERESKRELPAVILTLPTSTAAHEEMIVH